MPHILIGGALERFRFVIGVHGLRRAEDRRTRVEMQVDVALQMNAPAQIGARRNQHGATTCLRRRPDGAVNRRAVEGLAVTGGTEIPHIECGGD